MIELIGIWIRKNKPWSWILILFIAIPAFLQMHWWPVYQIVVFLTPGNHDTWIQFWGSYLGVIPSGIIAYGVSRYQIEQDKKATKDQKMEDKLEFRKREILVESKSIALKFKEVKPAYDELEIYTLSNIEINSSSADISKYLSYFNNYYHKKLSANIHELRFEVESFDLFFKEELTEYGVNTEIIDRITNDIIALDNDFLIFITKKGFDDGYFNGSGLTVNRTSIGQVTVEKIDSQQFHSLALSIFRVQKRLMNNTEFLFKNIKNNIDKK